MIRRGSVWLANLKPGKGTVPGKTRPVFVVQSQALIDEGHPSTVVLPLTSNLVDDAEPLRIRLAAADGLTKDSDILVDQICAIDNRRLIKGPLMQCNPTFLTKVLRALDAVLDLSNDFDTEK